MKGDQALLSALAAGDKARVAEIYAKGAKAHETAGDFDAAAFLLTNAWVFALEADEDLAASLKARLVALGRDTE